MYRHDCAHTGRSDFNPIAKPGTLRWKFDTGGGRALSSPAIGTDGVIYFFSGRTLYAINPDGTLRWKFETMVFAESSPATGTDGSIYVDSGDTLYAVNRDGTKKWAFKTGAWTLASPTIGVDGTILVASEYGALFAINPDGTKVEVLARQRGIFRTSDCGRWDNLRRVLGIQEHRQFQ